MSSIARHLIHPHIAVPDCRYFSEPEPDNNFDKSLIEITPVSTVSPAGRLANSDLRE